VALWILGFLTSILWYVFWIGLLGGVGYLGYRHLTKAESKLLNDDPYSSIGTGDIKMSWDEYDKKYFHK
jgi:4-hydroxybenzoate polyprenyltransferase